MFASVSDTTGFLAKECESVADGATLPIRNFSDDADPFIPIRKYKGLSHNVTNSAQNLGIT